MLSFSNQSLIILLEQQILDRYKMKHKNYTYQPNVNSNLEYLIWFTFFSTQKTIKTLHC